MSWQAYVDNNMVGTGKVQRAAIHGLDGSCWATSSGFSVSQQEAMELLKSLKDGSVSAKTIGGAKYMMLRNDQESKICYLKLKDKGGFCVCLTKQALVIGGYEESAGGAGNCNNVVEQLAQYLKESGY
ncbi:predicted protein [Nematostella vectensis]|uniref:Profilin n=1 Tax=Nematostella vectensis TaxID=45351 RepID=A7SIX3_NEMVE|nr:profilin-2 [Nematostella vectensis]EDO36356.1 predicted protein [Nematostella vectensis]|eukprot:XP_001628419.1 predicted protein [Nematostella vectensis]